MPMFRLGRLRHRGWPRECGAGGDEAAGPFRKSQKRSPLFRCLLRDR
jgi:hypothetical protein